MLSSAVSADVEITVNGEEYNTSISRATFEKLNGPPRAPDRVLGSGNADCPSRVGGGRHKLVFIVFFGIIFLSMFEL